MLDNAKSIFESLNADVVLTSAEDLRFYLTGFQSTFGYVITDKNGTTFYTDTRYIESAQKRLAGTGISVQVLERGATAYSLLKGYKKVAIPLESTYAPVYNKLLSLGYEIVDSSPAFVKEMAVKSEEELKNIKQSCIIADKAIEALYPQIKEGVTENELAALLEYTMRILGAEGTSFNTICAFGKNGSVPHYETGAAKLKFGDIILIDYGCKVNGYCSDSTRTFLFGDDGQHEEFKKTYQIVLDSQKLAKEKITSGITGKVADGYVRDYLAKYGLDKYFTHSLGHGLGVNIHEYPRLSPGSSDILEDNMVFSDEPGVYFEDGYGIRIEDSITLKDGKVVSLTESDKNLLIL